MKKNLKNGDPKREKLLKLASWSWWVGGEEEGLRFFVLPQFLHHIFNKNELKKLHKYMEGQTGPLINGMPAYFPSDIERFINGLPNID